MKQSAMASSETPAKARRHSAVVESATSSKIETRAKTASVTYGSNKSMRQSDNSQIDAVRDEGLPGFLQANFVDHEPVVMFRDTGSTIADNESSQQRMVEQTINQGKQISELIDTREIDLEKPDSSPFPWAVSSVATGTPAGNPTGNLSKTQETIAKGSNTDIVVSPDISTVGQGNTGIGAETYVQQNFIEPRPTPETADDVPAALKISIEKASLTNVGEEHTAAGRQSRSPTVRYVNSSPQVSVPRMRIKSSNQSQDRSDNVPRGRKRKASTPNLDSINSDDCAIGLPKENYKPRPSRRRATGIVEQPLDFSIIPENATKRRRKTANTVFAAPELVEDELAHDMKVASQTRATVKTNRLDESLELTESATERTMPWSTEAPLPGREEVRAALKKLNFPLSNTSFDVNTSEKLSPTKDASPLSATEVPTAAFVSMPPPSSPALSTSPTKQLSKAAAAFAMPPPSSTSSRRSRRSHTTIFEDHVDLGESQQRSPSLRQQQAARQTAALGGVKNGAPQNALRKRRTIVQDEDEDDEDELVKDSVVKEPPRKKRGRPAKVAAAKKAIAAERGLEDSDAEPGADETIEPPRKKGREVQAPAGIIKSAENVLEAAFDEHEIEVEADEPSKRRADECPAEINSEGEANDQVVPIPDDANAAAAADGNDAAKSRSRQPSSASNLAASPPLEKQTPPVTKPDSKAATAQTKPIAHTPIKTSSKVVHRVGLNRRQRVQPLLKIFRPPAQAKQR